MCHLRRQSRLSRLGRRLREQLPDHIDPRDHEDRDDRKCTCVIESGQVERCDRATHQPPLGEPDERALLGSGRFIQPRREPIAEHEGQGKGQKYPCLSHHGENHHHKAHDAHEQQVLGLVRGRELWRGVRNLRRHVAQSIGQSLFVHRDRLT